MKIEHEKPFIVIDKPEKLLAEKLKSRTTNKSISKSSNSYGTASVQSTQSCNTIEVDVWAFEKYHPISGLIVGIYPKGTDVRNGMRTWQYDNNILASLKNTWAFTKVIMEPAAIKLHNNAVYYPYDMVADNYFDYNVVVNDFSSYNQGMLYGSYIDEPLHRSSSVSDCRNKLSQIKQWWKNKFGNNSLFISGETCSEGTDYFDDICDYVNMTSYTDMISNFLVECVPDPTDSDQRDEWTEYNSSFGQKFNHLWISGESDRGEMDVLIGHAQNMGKNSIWLYAGEEGMSDQSYWDAISEFNYYAFYHGYLRREERKYIYVWTYIGYDDPCSDNRDTSWELSDIIRTGETRIR